MAYLTIILH